MHHMHHIYRMTHPIWGFALPAFASASFRAVLAVMVVAPPVAAAERVYVHSPIFVMMTNDLEMCTIEGYPGEDFFFPRLARLLEQSQAKGHPDSATTSAPLRSTP